MPPRGRRQPTQITRGAAAPTRRPTSAAAAPRVKNSYDAGSTGTRRTKGWRAPTASPNAAIEYNLATLRDRSRAATRNDGYAKGALDKLVTNLIGTGIKPLSQADDPIFRRNIQALWLQWTDQSDADGLLDWYGQETQAVRAWLEGGEAFVRLRPRVASDGLLVPLQVQVLEPELCPYTHNIVLPTGNRVRAGIEFNGIGRRVAYWFHPSRPGDIEDFDASQLRRVPAENTIHLFDPLRPGQRRGVPHLTQALIKLFDLDRYDDAVLVRQELSNMFMAFLKRAANPDGGSSTLHPLTGQPIETLNDQPLFPMEPGTVQELSSGEEVDFSEPPEMGSGYKDFTRQQLFHIAAAVGVPYEVLTGDLSGLNDRIVRVILHEFRRFVMHWQHQVVAFQLCRPVWRAFMDRVFLSGALSIPVAYVENPEPWTRVKWMPQGWPYLHPVQDVQAATKAVRAGYTSRTSVVGEQGEDADIIDTEQAADNARADRLGLKYDSDGRAAAAAEPAEPPEPEPAQA